MASNEASDSGGCRVGEVLQSVKSVEAEQVHIGKITFDGVRKHVLGD
jgi:hypothetical protein